MIDWQAIFTIASIAAGAFALGLAYLTWQYHALPGSSALLALSLATATWLLFYTLELQAGADFEALYMWHRLKHLGMVWVAPAWLAFALSYARGGRLSWRYLMLLVFPFVTLLVIWANPANVYWEQVSLTRIANVYQLSLRFGTWGVVFSLHNALLMLLGIAILLKHRRNVGEVILIGAAYFFPTLVLVLNQLLPLAFDLAPHAFALSAVILVFGVLRLGVFDLVPQAYDKVMMNMPDAVLVLDTENRILSVNEAWLNAYTPRYGRQIVGRFVGEVFPSLVQQMGQAFYERECLIELLDGGRVLEARIIALAEGNHFSGRAFLFRDITERKRAQQQLQQRADELAFLYQQVRQLEQVKTDMIRLAAHDLRNPISSVIGYLEMMLRDDQTEPLSKDDLQTMCNAAWRANALLSDILSLERIEELARKGLTEPVNLYDLLGELIAQYRQTAQLSQQSLQLEIDPQAEFSVVLGDAAQLTEAVGNLLGNALKYTPPAGHIIIRLVAEAQQLRFEVQDSGYGIPTEQQDLLFNPFYRPRTDKTAHIEGTGLGLHLVKNIVERHHGTLIFHSVYGEGSTFGFRLPIQMSQQELR